MCDQCGCGDAHDFNVSTAREEHSHTDADGTVRWHTHEGGTHSHDPGTRHLDVARPILQENQILAERNRGFLCAKNIVALNFVSSPGSGKTTLLAKTLLALGNEIPGAVIVGDLATDADAEVLRPTGAPVAQITTGTVCHLDARMVAAAIDRLGLDGVRLLFIENVGNLVCPASFDLGENHRVVLLSVTEGENKPLKYPPIFHGARVVLITKTDLREATGFDLGLARQNIARVAPDARIIEISSSSGEGIPEWIRFLREIVLP